jgi:excisionase family DNA binding protein
MSFTVRQAAAQLGISPALVYALVQQRRIRHERHGLGRGTIRIPESALDEYRRSREFGAEEPRPAPEKRRGRLTHLRLC